MAALIAVPPGSGDWVNSGGMLRSASGGALRRRRRAARRQPPASRLQRGAEGIFAEDHGDRRRGGRFRWFVSTCFAAGIGAFAILFALLGANDDGDSAHLRGRIPNTASGGPSPTAATTETGS